MPESRSTRSPRKPAAKKRTAPKATPVQTTSKPVSSAAAFKKKAAGFDVELPSGNVAKIRRPGITDLISKGLFPDEIMPVVQKAINKAQNTRTSQDALTQEDQAELAADPKKMAAVMDAMDRITAECVVEPTCRYHRRQQVTDGVLVTDPEGKPVMESIPDSERSDDIVYTDEVEIDDKSFIFSYAVGGSSEIATFRGQSSAAVAALADGEGVQQQTE